MSRRAQIISGSVGALVLLMLIAAAAVAAVRSDQVVPGVTVEGLDVGGLDADAVRTKLAPLATARSEDGLVFTHDGTEFVVDAVEIGVAVDLDALVAETLAAGRDGSFVGDARASLFGTESDLVVSIDLDEDALAARIAEIAAAVDTEISSGGVVVDPVTLTVTSNDPVVGVMTLQDEATTAATRALEAAGAETVELPVERTLPETDAQDVAEIAEQAEAAIADDLRVTSDSGAVTLTPRELAPAISSQVVPGDASSLELVVSLDDFEEHLLELLQPLTVAAKDASLSAPKNPGVTFDDKDDATWRPRPASVSVVPSKPGTEIDPPKAAVQLTDTVRTAARELELELEVVRAEYTTEMAQAARPDTLLSTFTSYHKCCQTRVHNIQRLADMVDDTTVLPGEQFSINQISGVRECSKGFRAAGMILDGEIVDSCGGGVSQFGTTTINAVFFAGLKADAYKPHSFYISRYPMAREATLNYPSPDIDVRFTNDTGAPILIRTAHTGTSITVSFYGRSDVTEVRADVGSKRNIKPFPKVRRVNRSLPAGTEKQIQGGQDGFRVSLTRTVVRGQSVKTDDWSNTYVPETEIHEYNPDKPSPKPSPSPTVPPSPKPTEPVPAPSEPAPASPTP